VCDSDYKCKISVDDFTKGIAALSIGLTKNQVKRLVILLDENMTGFITIEEY